MSDNIADSRRVAVKLSTAAEMVDVSVSHLRNEWNANRIVFKQKRPGSREVLVEVSELERWVKDLPAAEPKGRAS